MVRTTAVVHPSKLTRKSNKVLPTSTSSSQKKTRAVGLTYPTPGVPAKFLDFPIVIPMH